MKPIAVALALVSIAVVLHAPRAFADEGQVEKVARATFSTSKATVAIESTVCGLEGHVFVNGRPHAIDMRLDDQRCSTKPMPEDAFPVRVTLEALDGGLNGVTVEAEIPEGEHAAEDVGTSVKHIGGGAVMAIVGAISISVGGRKVDRVSAYVGPTGGGLRVAF